MDAVPFKQANVNLGPPEGDKDCMELPVYHDGTQFISKHQMTKAEMEEVAKTGVIWLYVLGQGHPPVALSTKNPFE